MFSRTEADGTQFITSLGVWELPSFLLSMPRHIYIYVLVWWWFSKSSSFDSIFFLGRKSYTFLYAIYYSFPFLETEKDKWKKQELLSQ